MRPIASQIVAARGLLGWTAKDLALAAGISLYAVQKLESTPGEIEPTRSFAEVAKALLAKGIVFTEDMSRIGVALDTRKR